MSNSQRDPAFRWRGTPITRRSLLAGLGAVGAFLAVDLGAVAYANDWIAAGTSLTRQTFIDGFRNVYGNNPGFRKNHAKAFQSRVTSTVTATAPNCRGPLFSARDAPR
jgi:catalase